MPNLISKTKILKAIKFILSEYSYLTISQDRDMCLTAMYSILSESILSYEATMAQFKDFKGSGQTSQRSIASSCRYLVSRVKLLVESIAEHPLCVLLNIHYVLIFMRILTDFLNLLQLESRIMNVDHGL